MATTNWGLDPMHSELQFKVKHMMISTVTGSFNSFTGTVETDDNDFSTAKIEFKADISSISTNNEQRDGHLKSADFFDAENHPELKFISDRMEKIDDENYKLHGQLTMHGETKPVSMNVEYGGVIKDPYGMTRAGFTLEGKINRKDYGLTYNGVLEAGGVMLSEEVRIHANMEFVKQEVAQTA